MKRVLVFGTFDILHPGHIYFLEQAKKYGDFLIVSLARDSNVRKIKKHHPTHTELERKKLLQSLNIPDHVVLGAKTDYIKHIIKQKPDVIALGYDQEAFTAGLKEKLYKVGLKNIKIVTIGSWKPKLYKSRKILRQI